MTSSPAFFTFLSTKQSKIFTDETWRKWFCSRGFTDIFFNLEIKAQARMTHAVFELFRILFNYVAECDCQLLVSKIQYFFFFRLFDDIRLQMSSAICIIHRRLVSRSKFFAMIGIFEHTEISCSLEIGTSFAYWILKKHDSWPSRSKGYFIKSAPNLDLIAEIII